MGGFLVGASLVAMTAGVMGKNVLCAGGFGFICMLILIICSLLITEYTLDIVKFGIERRNGGLGIDFVRQIVNAIIVVGFVYYIVRNIRSLLRILLKQSYSLLYSDA